MDFQTLSDQALLQHCLHSQDQACWTEFVRRFQPLLKKVVTKRLFRRIRPTPALVDDLVQETYLKLCAGDFKPLRNFYFQHENAFFGFLKVVADHVVEDYFRKVKPDIIEEDLVKVSAFVSSDSGSRPRAETETLIREIEQCLAERAADEHFSRDHAIFWLHYRQGLTAKQIASLSSIGLTVKGVESSLLRLTRYVREKLGPSSPKRTPTPPRKREASG